VKPSPKPKPASARLSPSPGTPGEGRGEGSPRDAQRLNTSRRAPRIRALDLEISPEAGAKHVAFVRSNLLQAHAILRPALHHLSLALVNDAKMAQLHKAFLNLPGPTDVLTFELDHDAKGRVTAGEVIVCVPEARRQARQRHSTIEKELLLYALHGMLHLCGFDDRTASEYRRMHRKEDQILTRLGIGPVFAADAPARPSRRRVPSARTRVK
jgi:rRNA maturation RNase YbeY